MKSILIADDERQTARVLRCSLQSCGYHVLVTHDGLTAFDLFKSEQPDLIIADLGMPGLNGMDLTEAVRRLSTTPIILLSTRDVEAVKIAALDCGADDFLLKPFSLPELLARVRVQMRRIQEPAAPEPILRAGDFLMDTAAHTVERNGQSLHLTPKEFELLALLLRNPGRVMTHKALLRSIWGPAGEGQPEYLRVLVGQLRKKVETSALRRYIQSEPWVGYRLKPSREALD